MTAILQAVQDRIASYQSGKPFECFLEILSDDLSTQHLAEMLCRDLEELKKKGQQTLGSDWYEVEKPNNYWKQRRSDPVLPSSMRARSASPYPDHFETQWPEEQFFHTSRGYLSAPHTPKRRLGQAFHSGVDDTLSVSERHSMRIYHDFLLGNPAARQESESSEDSTVGSEDIDSSSDESCELETLVGRGEGRVRMGREVGVWLVGEEPIPGGDHSNGAREGKEGGESEGVRLEREGHLDRSEIGKEKPLMNGDSFTSACACGPKSNHIPQRANGIDNRICQRKHKENHSSRGTTIDTIQEKLEHCKLMGDVSEACSSEMAEVASMLERFKAQEEGSSREDGTKLTPKAKLKDLRRQNKKQAKKIKKLELKLRDMESIEQDNESYRKQLLEMGEKLRYMEAYCQEAHAERHESQAQLVSFQGELLELRERERERKISVERNLNENRKLSIEKELLCKQIRTLENLLRQAEKHRRGGGEVGSGGGFDEVDAPSMCSTVGGSGGEVDGLSMCSTTVGSGGEVDGLSMCSTVGGSGGEVDGLSMCSTVGGSGGEVDGLSMCSTAGGSGGEVDGLSMHSTAVGSGEEVDGLSMCSTVGGSGGETDSGDFPSLSNGVGGEGSRGREEGGNDGEMEIGSSSSS